MNNLPSSVLAAFLGFSDNLDQNRALSAMLGPDHEYHRVLATSLNDRSPVREILDDEGEAQLKPRQFTDHDDCDTCPIFHIPFEVGDDVLELPCGHIFTPDGINKWVKEEKAECPVCRFKLKSKEVRSEAPGIEQWADDHDQLATSRLALANNLRRLAFNATHSPHPFGPASHRIANVVHEDDERIDIQNAFSMTFNSPSLINNIISSHSTGGNLTYTTVSTTTPYNGGAHIAWSTSNITYDNSDDYINDISYGYINNDDTATQMTYITVMTPPQDSYAAAEPCDHNLLLGYDPSFQNMADAAAPPPHQTSDAASPPENNQTPDS